MSKKITKRLDVMPVILAGGAGKRLYPLTSPLRPKPFLKGFDRNSLFQHALLRAEPFADPVIATATSYADRVFEQCYELGIKPAHILCEPGLRNTAVPIACAAFIAAKAGVKMLVMPSDHDIDDIETYSKTVQKATDISHDFILFTAKPKALSSRYGYIVSDKNNSLVRFIEKPERKTILELSKHGSVAWNTGIFLCRPDKLLALLQKTRPVIYAAAKNAVQKATQNVPFFFPDPDAYLAAPSISIDYAVMEHVTRAAVVPLDTGWSDVGTRSSYMNYVSGNIMKKLSV
jgi:mannose-1-phosphate guanylyltransferase